MSNLIMFSKMSAHRLQKLLMSKIYNGIGSDIILESPCFQLGLTGEIMRHVFIGVTTTDFLIAHQVIRDVNENIVNPKTDLELEGLELVCCVPLSMTHFSLWDDRSCKIAVCTDMGTSFFFEMCNLTDGSNGCWSAWREYISLKDNSSHFGYKSWKVYQSDSDTSEIDYSDVKFLKRPAAVCLVESVGTQACEDCEHIGDDIAIGKSPSITKHEYAYNEKMLKRLDKIEMVDVSSQIYTSVPELQVVGKSHRIIQVSSDILQLETEDIKPGYNGYNVKATRSQTNLIDCNTYEISSKSTECWKNWIFYMLLQYDSKSATRQLTFLFPNSCLSEDILRQYTKIWRARAKLQPKLQPKKLGSRTEISASLANENICNQVDKTRTKKRAQYRWRQTVVKLRQRSKLTLSNRVTGVFKTRSVKRVNTPHPDKFEASQIADELTLMAAELVLLITEEDLLAHQSGTSLHNIRRLWNLKMYSTMVVKFISKEILSAECPSDQAKIISYCLKVGEHCRSARNLFTLSSILKSLYSLPISRLTDTWNVFQEQFEDSNRTLKETATLFNPVNYFQAYNLEYTKMRASGLAYLPWFDHYRWHLSPVFSKNPETCESTVQTETIITEAKPFRKQQMRSRINFGTLLCMCCISVPKSDTQSENEPPYLSRSSCVCSQSKEKRKEMPKRVTFCLGNHDRNLMSRPQKNESLSSNDSNSLTEDKGGCNYPKNMGKEASNECINPENNFEAPNRCKYCGSLDTEACKCGKHDIISPSLIPAQDVSSDDNISNISNEYSRQINSTFGKAVSPESNCNNEQEEIKSSEFVEVNLDSDHDECSIGSCSIGLWSMSNNEFNLDLEATPQPSSSSQVAEYKAYKPEITDSPCMSAEVVTTLDNIKTVPSENHTAYSKTSLSKSNYELAGHKKDTIKNMSVLQASRSSPLVSRMQEGHERKPHFSPLKPYFEPDTTEGPKPVGQEKYCFSEPEATVSNLSVSKSIISCHDVVGDLLQIQLAALKYKYRPNAAVRTYITKSIPTDYQLLQMSLRSQPAQRNKEQQSN